MICDDGGRGDDGDACLIVAITIFVIIMLLAMAVMAAVALVATYRTIVMTMGITMTVATLTKKQS